MRKTIGGDRLGSGKKMTVELKNYERSTHDLGYIWRSTMAAGTLVPFLSKIALPGDTFDIKLTNDVMTHPTLGPLFASFKVQLDIFEAPIRLYHSALHNNMLQIGNHMEQILLPKLSLNVPAINTDDLPNIDYQQINPSSILAYLGIRGWGYTETTENNRQFNAIPFLAYWEIYKNYYANKQEEIGVFVNPPSNTQRDITEVDIDTTMLPKGSGTTYIPITLTSNLTIDFGAGTPDLSQVYVHTDNFGKQTLASIGTFTVSSPGVITSTSILRAYNVNYWDYVDANTTLQISTFPLSVIDDMRQHLLASGPFVEFDIVAGTADAPDPYQTPLDSRATGSQCGLGIKTYQSDLLNNWIQTEWLDGVGGINSITAVDTSAGSFHIDALIMAKKLYVMLNQIAISGGTYDDWQDAVYNHERYTKCETPMYHGGLSKELVFQQVISMANSGPQPLGTLGGRGTMSHKHKGGDIVIKVDEPGYIIGIVSLTPRIDYSQGNDWDTHLVSMNDLHKPALDEIGFQELITEQMAWWDTHWNSTTSHWDTRSAGKQPAWLNYMTSINKTYGNFAIKNNEMFMTLNRRYDIDLTTKLIKDVTTYIDPQKYNFIFAQTSLDAQNFWVQIAVDMTVRRKMSAKVMPNL